MVQYSEISFGIVTYPTEIIGISILQLTFGIGTLQFIGMGMWSPKFQQNELKYNKLVIASIQRYLCPKMDLEVRTEGSCLMRLQGLRKSGIIAKFSLAKYLANAIFWQFFSLLRLANMRILGKKQPKNCTNEIAQNSHKANIHGMFLKMAVMTFILLKLA